MEAGDYNKNSSQLETFTSGPADPRQGALSFVSPPQALAGGQDWGPLCGSKNQSSKKLGSKPRTTWLLSSYPHSLCRNAHTQEHRLWNRDSKLGSLPRRLCDLGHVAKHLCASVSSSVTWERCSHVMELCGLGGAVCYGPSTQGVHRKYQRL